MALDQAVVFEGVQNYCEGGLTAGDPGELVDGMRSGCLGWPEQDRHQPSFGAPLAVDRLVGDVEEGVVIVIR